MKKSGFTLIELLLVVAIIGILIGILLPTVVGVTQESKEKKAKGDIRTLVAAIEQYYIKRGVYPSNKTGAQADDDGTTTNGFLETKLLGEDPRLVNEVPSDPFEKREDSATNKPYKYKYSVNNWDGGNQTGRPTYVIWSVGPKGCSGASVNVGDDKIEWSGLGNATTPEEAGIIYYTNAKTTSVTP